MHIRYQSLHLSIGGAPSRAVAYNIAKVQATKYTLHCFQSKISLVWKYGMEYGMEDFWYGMEMEWKKIASMEYGKIVFHSIPYHALSMGRERSSIEQHMNAIFGRPD